MEDLNELYKLLERADAAGDDESVATLIPYIKQVETAAASQSAKKEPVVDVTQPQPDLTQPPVVKPAIQAPIDVMGQQFPVEEYKKYTGMPIATKPGEQAKGEFSGSFGRSIYSLAADLALAQGKVTGNYKEAEETAKRLREYGNNTYTNTTKGWKEDPLAKIQELAGGSAPYMIAPITAALGSTALGVTGIAAVAAPMIASTVQFTGSNLQRQMDQNKKLEDTSLLKAGGLAIPQAALDQLGFRFIPGVQKLFGKAGIELTEEAASTLVKKSILVRAGEKALATGKGMGVEGGTEAGQQLLERLQAGLSITNAEARKEYFDSFVGGVALAGAFGVSGQVIESVASRLPEQKQAEVEKELIEEPPTEEQRPSRETLKKEFLAELEAEANEINQAKADKAAQLKASQQQQVVTEATDLESMAPVNPTELTDTTLTSWGLNKNSKAYKTLIGQDAGTPEGRTLIDTALEAHTGKINEPAVDTYKSLLDQQKVEATNEPQTDTGPGIDTGTIGINNEVPGQPKYGTPGTAAGYNEPTVNIGGTPITLPKRGEADVNAPLETVAPVVETKSTSVFTAEQKAKVKNRIDDIKSFINEYLPLHEKIQQSSKPRVSERDKRNELSDRLTQNLTESFSILDESILDKKTELGKALGDLFNYSGRYDVVKTNETLANIDNLLKTEEAPVEEVAPVSTQPKLASQLRALDSTNPLIEALQYDQASEEEVAVAQNTIKELQASRKAKRADLTKVSEEEKDIPLEARGEIQNTGETPDTIEATFQKQYGKNVRLAKQRGLLNFLNDVSELPPEVGPVTPGTKAVYHKGKGYFITNRITREDAPRMLLHEIGAHYGLEGMLGTTNYKRVVKQIKQKHLTDKELKASWDNTVKTYPEYPEGSNNFMQEVIANIGETAPNNTIFRQIVGYIKQFLSKLGYGWDINKITADDIRDMVQQSVRMSLAGKIKGTQPGITMKGEEEGALKPTYYSHLTRVITNAQFKNNVSTQSGDQWIGWLNSKTSEAGVKRDELEFSGILEFLDLNKSEKFDKQDILTYLDENGTKVDEYTYGDGEGNSYSDKDKEEWVEQGVSEWVNSQEEGLFLKINEEAADTYDFPYYVREENVTDAEGNKLWRLYFEGFKSAVEDTYYFSEDEAQELADEYNNQGMNDFADNLYEQYKQGIDNQADTVREELADQWDEDHEIARTRFLDWTLDGGDHKYTEVVIALQNPKKGATFSTDHWRDISNPIAHYRVNARTDTKGNIVLFVEEIQGDWAQAAKKLRKKHITNLAENWKANTNSPLTVEQISKQIAKFVPGDWGFKKEFTPEQQKTYDNISTMLSEKQNKRKLFRDQIRKYHDFEEQLIAYIDHEVRKIISPNINTSRRTTVVSELSDDDFKVHSEYNSTRNYYIQTILNKDLSPYNTTIYGYKINNNIVKQILDQPGVISNVNQRANNIKEIDKILYEVESIDEDIKDLESKKRSLSQFGKIDRAQFVQKTEAWSNLVLKNIIRFAAERGYDKVAFVNGKQAAFKGGKAEAIDEVFGTKNKDGTFNIYAILKDGGGKTRTLENIRDLDLEDYIGGLANKFRGLNVGETDGWDAGELKLPSKGMVEFYDGMILRDAAKLIKKLGGHQLETIELIPPNQDLPVDEKVGIQRGFTITSAMRDKAMAGQPLFARASKQQLDDDLKNSGTVGKEKEPKPTTFDRFKDKPLKTIDEIIANFRKSFFSFDAAINNKILIAMRQQKIPQQEVAKSFYEMQVGQALHADQLSDMWMVHGGIKYDPESFSFVIEDFKDSMSTIREQLSAIAKKRNVSEFEMFQYGHAAFVAQRSQDLIDNNNAIKDNIRNLLVKGKKAAAAAAAEKGFKLVHLTPAQIKYGMNFFKTIPELKKIHKTWNKNRRRLLQFAVDNGLYTTEKAEDLLDVINFVPFYREAQDEDNQIPKPFTRGILDTAIDKRLKGSYRPVNNVFDNMERWASYTLKKAINNKAAQEKIKFYSKYLPDDIKIIKDTSTTGNAVGVWYDGKVVKYEFQGYDGKSMVDGFTGLEPVINLVVPKILNKYATFQRAQIVLEPLFNAAQITMDAFDALFSSGIELPVLLPLQVVKEVLLSPLGLSKARTYLKKTGDVGKRDWASEYNNIDLEAMKQLKQLKTSDKIIKAVLSPVVASYKGLKFLGMASDNIIRQAVWSQIMLETGNVARATYVAREIINFRRTGSNAYISAARQMAPFVNANLQAANIAFGTMLFSGITPDSKVVQLRRLITSGAQVTAAILILTALNSDDDDYKKLDPKDRDRLLMLPGSGGYALPVRGSIITLIYKILPEHLYNRYIEESEDSEKLRKSLTEAFKRAIALPTGFPTLVTPVLEMALNLDTVTGLPLRGQSQKNLEADLQYSNKYTSQLARWANDATGISPIVVQNFMNRWLASTSMLISMFTNKLIADIRGEMLPEKTSKEKFLQLPSGSKFVTKQQNTRNINDYYELNDIVNSIVDSANKYKNIDYPKYQEYIAKDNRAEIINMKKEMAAISKELEVLRNYENKIYASKDANRWTPTTKKAELDRLEGIRQNMLGSQLKLKERSDRYIQQLRYRGGL